MDNSNKLKNSVNSSIKMFFVWSIVFVILKCFIDSRTSPENIGINNRIFLSCFSLFFILFSYTNNISATENKMICGKRNSEIAFYTTIIPFIFIYLIGVLCVSIFPGWIRCFSNTFGSNIYWITGLQESLINKIQSSDDGDNYDNELKKLFSEKPITLLNELVLDANGNIKNYEKINRTLGILNENTTKIVQFINMKNTIGSGIWYFLFGTITILVSYNSLISENCNNFKDNQSQFNKYLNDKLKMS